MKPNSYFSPIHLHVSIGLLTYRCIWQPRNTKYGRLFWPFLCPCRATFKWVVLFFPNCTLWFLNQTTIPKKKSSNLTDQGRPSLYQIPLQIQWPWGSLMGRYLDPISIWQPLQVTKYVIISKNNILSRLNFSSNRFRGQSTISRRHQHRSQSWHESGGKKTPDLEPRTPYDGATAKIKESIRESFNANSRRA